MDTSQEPEMPEGQKKQNFTPVTPTKEKVIEILRKDEGDKILFNTYTADLKNQLEMAYIAPKDRLQINIDMGDVYVEAGMMNEALNAYSNAADLAEKLHEYELHEQIITRQEDALRNFRIPDDATA